MPVNFKSVREYSKGLSVLYAEDDKNVLDATAELLKDFFKVVDTSLNGEDALNKYNNYYEENQKHYDLLITDVVMPKMDGITLTNEVKKINSEQEIIVVSAQSDSHDIENILFKPVSSEELMTMLYDICKKIVNRSH